MECKKCKSPLAEEFVFCPYCGQNQKKAVKKRRTIRRENGAGSVYKRSDLKSKPWVAAAPLKNGKQEIIGCYATAQEAKDVLHEYCKNPTDKLNYTLADVYKAWLPSIKDKSKQWQDGCRASYNKLINLQNCKMRNLKTDDYQHVINDLQTRRPKLDKNGNQEVKKGELQFLEPMSYATLHNLKILIGQLSKYAMQQDIINKDYSDFITLPPKPKGVKDCFTDDELAKIKTAAFGLNGTPKIQYADYVLFMCFTGLRITEFLTLDKSKVHAKGGKYALYGGIKTDAGKDRIVPVHSLIVPILQNQLDIGGDVVFCKPDKTSFSVNYFREKIFVPTLKKIGVRQLTPHATRRTMATLMSKSGVREEDFTAIMGHADFKVDIDSYIYQDADKLRPSIELISI